MLEVSDIKGRTFEVQKNGYNPVEVDAFLSDVAAQYKELLNKNQELERKLEAYKEDSSAISEALIIAQREANKILNDAKTKARDMVENAKSEQVRLAEQSAAECERIVNEHKERCAQLIKTNTEETEAKITQIKDAYDEQKAAYVSLREEVTYFKSGLIDLYNRQLKLIMDMPSLSDEEIEKIEKGEDIDAEETDSEETVENAEENVDSAENVQKTEEDEETEEETSEEVSEEENSESDDENKETISDPEQVNKVLHTGSFEPVIPKDSLEDLKFGKNN